MSIWIDYFFKSDESFEQLRKDINSSLGCNLVSSEEDTENSGGRIFGMELSFMTHTLESDAELNLEDYKYEIGLTTYWGSADLREIQVSLVAFIANLLYRRMRINEGMLVYDAQRLLAIYEEKLNPEISEKGLFDIVSNKFVVFPNHLIDLHNLAWNREV